MVSIEAMPRCLSDIVQTPKPYIVCGWQLPGFTTNEGS